MARIFVALVMVLVACSQTPGSGATPAPTGTPVAVLPTSTASATAQPTPSPAVATPPASGTASCDPYYNNCEPRYTPRTVPSSVPATPAGTALVVGVSAGGKLVDPDGMSLYVLDDDSAGEPTCLTGCADNWPPLTVSADGTQHVSGGPGVSGAFTTFERSDAAVQVIYNNRPLYHYAGDSAPGEINGDAIGGVWHLATP